MHTPGPWKVVAADWGDFGDKSEEIKGVVRYYVKHEPNEIKIDNARLIEAAPFAIEMLRSFVAETLIGTDDDGPVGPKEPLSYESVARMAWDIALAIIAKSQAIQSQKVEVWCPVCGEPTQDGRAHAGCMEREVRPNGV